MDVIVKENEIKHKVVAAYNEVLRKLRVVKTDTVSNEDEVAEQQIMDQQKIIEVASHETSDDLVKNLSELKLQINRSLEEIKNKLLPQYEKFQTLRQAIKFSENELNEQYGIKVNVDSLNALIVAQKEKNEIFETEMAERRRVFENQMAQQEHAHSQEENEYLMKRDGVRKMEQEQYDANRKEIERELEERRAAMEEDFEAREARVTAKENEYQKLKQREAQITAHEQEFKQLKEYVLRYPNELRNAVQQAEQSIREQLTRKYEYDTGVLKIELESERKMYQQKISALEEKVEQYKSLKQMFGE